MKNILCHINDEPFAEKPTDLKFMGKLRDKLIQKPWDYLTETDFVKKVCSGYAWYGCLFNGHDLMHCDSQSQRGCWRAQSVIAVDIDKCPIAPTDMAKHYTDLGFIPWMVYRTFSDDPVNGPRSYRMLWRVEVDHSITYEQWAEVIKGLSRLTEYGDKHARDCTRMWQGGHHLPNWWIPNLSWDYSSLAKKLIIS